MHEFTCALTCEATQSVVQLFVGVKGDLYLEVNRIATNRNDKKLGKMIVRSRDAVYVFIHTMFAQKPRRHGNGRSRLLNVAGDVEYNLLHFKQSDWDRISNDSTRFREYNVTFFIAAIIRQRLSEAGNTVAHVSSSIT